MIIMMHLDPPLATDGDKEAVSKVLRGIKADLSQRWTLLLHNEFGAEIGHIKDVDIEKRTIILEVNTAPYNYAILDYLKKELDSCKEEILTQLRSAPLRSAPQRSASPRSAPRMGAKMGPPEGRR